VESIVTIKLLAAEIVVFGGHLVVVFVFDGVEVIALLVEALVQARYIEDAESVKYEYQGA
jgi:hypothetical protein